MTHIHAARPINLREYAALARSVMDSRIWDTYAQGAEDERTLRANERAWGDVWLRPRTLVDVTECDPSTTALGAPLAFPAMIAPMSLQALAHPDAEEATARAASAQGVAMVASTLSSRSLEQIAAASRRAAGGGPLWFQLYLYPDEAFNLALLRRVEQAGYQAIVLTVDAPYIGNRERDRSNHFAPPPAVSFGNFADAPHVTWATRGQRLPLTWQTLDWLRAHTTLPIMLKGVLSGDDARRAVDAGAQGIAVSNHGGRQLDGTIPTRYALPEVVAAVGGRCEVYVDGGIRRGVDILRARALGAQAALIGRPIIWGLAVHGEEGVCDILSILRDELTLALRLAGHTSLATVDETIIARVPRQSAAFDAPVTREGEPCDD
jgi:4-hydroxymandelate oxidase